MNRKNCPNCGEEIDEKSRYCNQCGAEILYSNFDNSGNSKLIKNKLNKKWIFISAIIIFFSEFLFAFIVGFSYIVFFSGDMTTNQLIIISSIGSIGGVFIGSVLSAYKSPCATIKESVVGVVLIVLIMKIINMIVTETFSLSFVTGIVIAYAMAFAGIFLGEKLKNK